MVGTADPAPANRTDDAAGRSGRRRFFADRRLDATGGVHDIGAMSNLARIDAMTATTSTPNGGVPRGDRAR
jgi:hypothetical protein